MSAPTLVLVLTNGYPYPYPTGLSPEEADALAAKAAEKRLEIPGVVDFQWLHTLTIEFTDFVSYVRMSRYWKFWSPQVLEAPTSSGDGYGHPAIIVGDTAYCGFMLRPQQESTPASARSYG